MKHQHDMEKWIRDLLWYVVEVVNKGGEDYVDAATQLIQHKILMSYKNGVRDGKKQKGKVKNFQR